METKSAPRENRTICIEFPTNYDETLNNPSAFRAVVDGNYKRHPELFPLEIAEGYELKEIRTSKKTAITVRRILINGISYTIRPSFVMPYMTGLVRDVETPCFCVNSLSLIGHWRKLLAKTQCISIAWKRPLAVTVLSAQRLNRRINCLCT